MTPSEFENHPIFEKLEQLSARLSENEVREVVDLDKLNFYETTHKFIADRLKITLPALIPSAELSTISQEIENGLSQLNNFLGNKNPGHLANADSHFHSALSRIRNLPLILSKSDFNFSRSISDYEKLVKTKYELIEKQNEKLKLDLESVNSELIETKNQITQIKNQLVEKGIEINNITSTFQTEFNNIKTNAINSFESDRKVFRSEITTDRTSFQEEISESVGKFETKFKTSIEGLDKNGSLLIQNLNTKLEEAKRIVNVIGNVGVTGNYQNIANQHKSSANTFRIIAIVFMTALSAILIYTIWDIKTANFDWIKSVIRIVAAAALSYPATYAARESSKHRKLETINRKLELELASLTPFIEMLPEEKKKEIKTKLVEKYFGNHHDFTENSNEKEEELSLGGFEKILKAILPILKK